MKVILKLNVGAEEFKLIQIKVQDNNNIPNIIPVKTTKLQKKIIRPILIIY